MYDKPKVTIDLDEYNYLLKTADKETLKKDIDNIAMVLGMFTTYLPEINNEPTIFFLQKHFPNLDIKLVENQIGTLPKHKLVITEKQQQTNI
tara:strand:- start:12641 stop:12916 length:276 start_codon:yes stop_codon:yes gene_type:complete